MTDTEQRVHRHRRPWRRTGDRLGRQCPPGANLARTGAGPCERRSLVNRYYDPATGQFLSRDPLVNVTGEPYAYVEGNPLSGVDPMGLCPWGMGEVCHLATHEAAPAWNATGGAAIHDIASGNVTGIVGDVHTAAGALAAGAAGCALIAAATGVGNLGPSEVCGAVAAGSATLAAGTGLALRLTGNESNGQLGLDLGGFAFGGVGDSLGGFGEACALRAAYWAGEPGFAPALRTFGYDLIGPIVRGAGSLSRLIGFGISSGDTARHA